MRLVQTCLLLTSVLFIHGNNESCPPKCTCRRISQAEELFLVKVRCTGSVKISNFEEIDLGQIAPNIVQLNLSNNHLSVFHPKIPLNSVQKLDLSRNKLTELQNNQFNELPKLRRLDLSGNSIKIIHLSAFTKLAGLERLKLAQNNINTILLGTLDPLTSLKQLDISGNPLTCDCSLLWLLDWTQERNIKLVANPTYIHCKTPIFNPLITLTPSVNQVVFEGDSLKFDCSAPSISDNTINTRIEWSWSNSEPRTVFEGITVDNEFLQSKGLIFSRLQIPRLRRNHTGIWSCLFYSLQGNFSRSVTIVVISETTKYCPIVTTTNNKGTYNWPRTVVNYTASLPCQSFNLNYDASQQKGTYFCSENSTWSNLNTTQCSFISENTKILEQFSKVNSSLTDSVKPFRNYTTNPRNFHDSIDIFFAVQTINNYLKYKQVDHHIILDVINNLLQLPKRYFWRANVSFDICGKLLNITEKLIMDGVTAQKTCVVGEAFPVKKTGFTGLKCNFYINRPFSCVVTGNLEEIAPEKNVLAAILIPGTLFDDLEEQGIVLPQQLYKILVVMFAENELFPLKETDEDIKSAIIGVKLGNFTVSNLTEPVVITLKTPPPTYSELAPLIPVSWSQNTWTQSGCEFSHEVNEHTVFTCNNLGYYALKQHVTNVEMVRAKFRLSHPTIYFGSFFLFLSFLFAILTYLILYPTIQMPKKSKHCMINSWISVVALCFMYVFGIYQTEDVRVCQVVGILLHYFTLSSLLWMCVNGNCIYKRLSKSDLIQLEDELPSEPIKKPILGLYFVGWGIAIIVCGISAAINIRDYSASDYCFLRLGPPLSALYIPVGILLCFLFIISLLIRCAIYNLDANGQLSEGTQATENVDLDLLEPNYPTSEARSVLTASSEAEDSEHSPSLQLKSLLIFLVLYLLVWISGALAVMPIYTEIFSILYAVFCVILSAFTVFFYCVARSDVRNKLLANFTRKKLLRSRNISDASPQIQPVASIVEVSRSSSRSSSRTKSQNSAGLKGVDLNTSFSSEGAKINNVNLVVLHRQQYRNNLIPNIIENPTSAEVFYNPQQSIVARKFFKRQKRHMKRNNLMPRPCASSTSTLSKPMNTQNLFGTNSKVNNTNIHVERVKSHHHKNPNIFSDSGDDYERKNPDNMRSVSQQCTLDYSSENISDSILDKSPEKPKEEASDLDELYQQIRNGPGFHQPARNSPDDDIETTV